MAIGGLEEAVFSPVELWRESRTSIETAPETMFQLKSLQLLTINPDLMFLCSLCLGLCKQPGGHPHNPIMPYFPLQPISVHSLSLCMGSETLLGGGVTVLESCVAFPTEYNGQEAREQQV